MDASIIVDNFGDLMVFTSVKSAETWMEAIDVINDEYVIYDSAGRLLKASVTKTDRVVIDAVESEPSHTRELRDILVDHLSGRRIPREVLERESLETIVQRASIYKVN
jgi:hypothetical protein